MKMADEREGYGQRGLRLVGCVGWAGTEIARGWERGQLTSCGEAVERDARCADVASSGLRWHGHGWYR